jgi:NADH-quinone oxidoreductase subunit L
MVTAGVYVVARSHVLFTHSETALVVVAIVGCATAFFAATIGLVQTDIKKVLAYSTVSQLGYMFLACGAGAFSAGIFHLMTHAFFKALLFLAAGSVIHAMGGEQDMNHMGGLSKKIPWTFGTMLVATLAITGIPFFAGFFSKDAILLAAFQIPGGHPLYAVGLLTALLTSFYMFRLIFLTFHGKARYDERKVHVHESPWSMLGPLVVLAVLSFVGGWFALPAFFQGPDYFSNFLAPVFGGHESAEVLGGATAHTLELTLAFVAVSAALAGLGVAYWLYLSRPSKPGELAKSMKGLYTTLLNKYYVDELYAVAIVKPLLWISTNVFWKTVDVGGIDGAVNGVAEGLTAVGDGVRHMQSGNTRSYAVWVVIGAIVIITVVFFWTTSGKPVVGMVR